MSQMTEERLHEVLDAQSFYNLGDAAENQEIAANTRSFIADGTPFLSVPGLLRVDGVRSGNLTFPKEIVNKIPLDASLTNHTIHRQPCVFLAIGKDGQATLLRNRQSNDGIWQDGVVFHVTGEWDAAVAETILPPKETKKKG